MDERSAAGGLAPEVESFGLRGGRRPLTLHTTGLRHAAPWLSGGEQFVPYEEVTDVSGGRRGLRIGTRENVLLLPRALFRDPDAPERLARSLHARIGRLPEGPLQLARMAEVEAWSRRGARILVTGATAALCVLFFVLGWLVGPELGFAGHFGATLAAAGEHWRFVTGNLLHAGFLHLSLNVLGLVVLGELVEKPLGSARTAVLVVLSGLGAMLGSATAGYEEVVGASGIVCGLAGALVYLELQMPERLPAAWRVPRRLLYVALVAEVLLAWWVPVVAGAAHAGGFVAGLVGAAVVAPRAPQGERAPSWVTAAAALALTVALAGSLALVRELRGGPAVLADRAERLLGIPQVSPVVLNNTAWMIATEPDATEDQIAVALRSAKRAVAETRRRDPNFLDTLAEAWFAAGRKDEAVETIDEAIALAPGEPYFVEQRRRFTGERAADDRPAPPAEPPPDARPMPAFPEQPRPGPPWLPPGHPPVDGDPGFRI